jgi:hypothetical protein
LQNREINLNCKIGPKIWKGKGERGEAFEVVENKSGEI